MLPARMVALGVLRLREAGDRHRRLALAVDLREARAEEGERALQIRHINRPAAIDDGLEDRVVGGGESGAVDETRHHGGGGEEADVLPAPQERGDLGGIEMAAL